MTVKRQDKSDVDRIVEALESKPSRSCKAREVSS